MKVIEGGFGKDKVRDAVDEDVKQGLLELCETMKGKIEAGEITDVAMLFLFSDGGFGTSGCYHANAKTMLSLSGGMAYMMHGINQSLEYGLLDADETT